ncbi:MAG: hypothetical protein LUI60_01575 [Clostridia bacterium]|nr:hypothetical protein [Clostridia bacterium]
MSEIRLADDDKDKKYRIRINEDGEEEFEIIEPEEQPEEDFVGLQADIDEDETMAEEDDELMAAAREEQKRLAVEEARGFIEKAKERASAGDTEYALVALDSAQEAWDEEWEIYSLKLELLTNNFTDFTHAEECASLEEGYKKYVPEEVKQEFRGKYAENIQKEIDSLQTVADKTKEENEAKKADRRVRFKARRNKSLRNFIIAFVPFLIFLGVAIGLSTYMIYDDVILVFAIIFYVLAAAAFVLSVICLRFLARDAHRVHLNELDSSTAIGRSYLDCSGKIEALKSVYDMLMYTAPVKEEKAEYAAIIDGEVSEI